MRPRDDKFTPIAACLAVVLAVACSGEGETTRDAAADTPSTPVVAANLPDRDPTLAPRGEELFTARACVGCHTVGGGRLVGPDLHGVTDRRSREWIMSMITNPDSMLRADTTARRLLGEYFTPMANQGISSAEAAALFEYLLAAGTDTQSAGGAN